MSFWPYRFALIVAFVAPIPGQQLPPVYFNHFVMFMNQATMADVADSPFLNQDFGGFDKTTTQANGGKRATRGFDQSSSTSSPTLVWITDFSDTNFAGQVPVCRGLANCEGVRGTGPAN